MPYGDGTGPYGAGPNGRGRGSCRAEGYPIGRGMGVGRCRGGRFAPLNSSLYSNEEPPSVSVKKSIELEAEMLERRLKALKSQLRDMESEPQ